MLTAVWSSSCELPRPGVPPRRGSRPWDDDTSGAPWRSATGGCALGGAADRRGDGRPIDAAFLAEDEHVKRYLLHAETIGKRGTVLRFAWT